MAKNWLIRTKSNHILGPVSKEKVLELYNNGSIKPDDEVCSGNGYWFFLRETDLVEKYLTGNEVQGFNPISEAKDVLIADNGKRKEPTMDDITLVGAFKLSNLQGAKKSHSVPEVQREPEVQKESDVSTGQDVPEVSSPAITKKKVNSDIQYGQSGMSARKVMPKQDYLKYLMVFGFLVILFLIYFRKTILNSFFRQDEYSSFSLINQAHAQDGIPVKKKSSLRAK